MEDDRHLRRRIGHDLTRRVAVFLERAIGQGRASYDVVSHLAAEAIREAATERFVPYHRMLEDDPRTFIVLADQHPAGTGSGQTFVGRMAGIEAAGVRVDSG